jgi:hypothetical protein
MVINTITAYARGSGREGSQMRQVYIMLRFALSKSSVNAIRSVVVEGSPQK